jgi:electron transport complex protein RnfD
MYDVLFALLFVCICSIVLQYHLYGIGGAIKAIVIMAICVITTNLVNLIYWKIMGVAMKDMFDKIAENASIITGLILALTLPLGANGNYEIFYVAFIASIIAELFGKLIFGGFGCNIFNPAGIGRAFCLIAFAKVLETPTIDGLGSSSPLLTLQGNPNDLDTVKQSFGSFTDLLFGFHQGAIGETLIIPLIIAAIYLLARRVIDWIIPVVSVVCVGLFAFFYSVANGTFSIDFVLIHLLSGGLFFGSIFMLTDPVTNPNTKQGKFIFAILFALITFLIRAKGNLPEGVVFAILICNMFVPFIDSLTVGVTNENTKKKILSTSVFLIICILLVMAFTLVA